MPLFLPSRVVCAAIAVGSFAGLSFGSPSVYASEAEADGLLVRTDSCDHLDSDELVRLTRLEIGSGGSLEVAYHCDEAHIIISVTEPARSLSVSRKLPRDCCDAAAERTLALLAAGLHAVAAPLWSARANASPPVPSITAPIPMATPATTSPAPAPPSLPSPPPRSPSLYASPSGPPPTPTRPSYTLGAPLASPPAANRGLAPVSRSERLAPPAQPDSLHQISAGAQVRFYNVTSGLTSYGARLQYLHALSDDFALGPIAEADFGHLARDGGSITTRVFHLGASGSWRFARGSWTEGTLAPFAAASFVQLEGSATGGNTQGSSISGLTGAGGLRLGAILGAGPVRLSATGEGGLLFRAPRGEVAGQADVQLDGLWLGVGLGVDLGWGVRLEVPAETVARGRS